MPLTWNCTCGKLLRVRDEHGGSWVKCPACSDVTLAPEADPVFEIVENTNTESVPPSSTRPATTRPRHLDTVGLEDEPAPQGKAIFPTSKKQPEPEQEEKEEKRAGYKMQKPDEHDNDQLEKNRRDRGERPWEKQKKEDTDQHHKDGFGLERWILNGGVLGGLLTMFIAVVWFVAGYAAGRIFFYPPILFVVGFIAMVKGAVKNE
jgi:hypothetical protein